MTVQPIFAAVAAVLLVLATLSFVASPPARAQTSVGPAVSRDMIGIVVRDPWYEFGTHPAYPNQPNYIAQERMGQILAEAGVRWVRVEFLVRDRGAGSFTEQIARYDYFINEVAPRYGLSVMGLLGFGLVDIDARDPAHGLIARTDIDPVYGGGVNPYMRLWLDRALQIMNRYRGRVVTYEILNEQNRLPGEQSFAGGEGIDPVLTGRLHTKLYRCFKRNECDHRSADPAWRAGITLVIGGLHPRGSDILLPSGRRLMTDRDYLAELYTSEPFSGYFGAYGAYPADALGYHPYPAEIRLAAPVEEEVGRIDQRLELLRLRLRQVLRSTSPAAAEVPLWITEIGYNAAYLQQNSAGQAAFLRAVYRQMAARSDVAVVFWFKYEDFPPLNGPNAQHWGIVRIPFVEDPRCPGGACYDPTGEPAFRREAYFTLRELAGLPVQRRFLPLMGR
ncbi:MAG: hypothetical protein ACUVS4_09005 [Chloroflexaceae bacterium]